MISLPSCHRQPVYFYTKREAISIVYKKVFKLNSDRGNRTPGCRVRDGDVSHYTISDIRYRKLTLLTTLGPPYRPFNFLALLLLLSPPRPAPYARLADETFLPLIRFTELRHPRYRRREPASPMWSFEP
ncbi:hypothetical protein ACN38_g11797 [Penicillium nordicum]|uniref:Uncharacterized protein n=1 Tax=Penicillium nordicum TaxID=229535 RepID=A0A0M9WAE6_9EURO|nr:hypothetical protein ACN38_g11797 [Penicillium nordicum]